MRLSYLTGNFLNLRSNWKHTNLVWRFFKKRQTKNFRRTYLTWLDRKFAQKSGIISIRSNK